MVSRKGEANSDGSPNDVDQEFMVMPMIFDESKSKYILHNMAERLPQFGGNTDASSAVRSRLTYQLQLNEEFKKSNKMHSINGKLFCGLPEMAFGSTERVRWYVMSLGDEHPHTPSWEGATLDLHHHRVNTLELMAASMVTADMTSATPGSWNLFCNVDKYLKRGMTTQFTVTPTLGYTAPTGSTRTYYIAADEVDWNYLPLGENVCADPNANPHHHESKYIEDNGFESEEILLLQPARHRIGSEYRKGQYREYTDDSFDHLKSGRSSRFNGPSEHLGLLGPVLRGEAGDVITISFKNRLRFPCNFFLQGVRPLSSDAFAPVASGATASWRFEVLETSAPAESDKSSVAYSYYSQRASAARAISGTTTDATILDNFADFNAGLFGALIVTRAGDTRSDLSPSDVQQEFVSMLSAIDENLSPYLDININLHAADPDSVVKNDPFFKESNRMPSINGMMYCNLPGLRLVQDRTSRWYLMSLGSDEGMHSPTWTGETASVSDPLGPSRHDSVELLPGSSRVADIHNWNQGVWLFEDQVLDYTHKGARALYKVTPKVTVICSVKFYSKC